MLWAPITRVRRAFARRRLPLSPRLRRWLSLGRLDSSPFASVSEWLARRLARWSARSQRWRPRLARLELEGLEVRCLMSAPVITSLSLTSGLQSGGYALDIHGSNLVAGGGPAGGPTVRFGTTQATITSQNATQITVVVPEYPGALAGPVTVDVSVFTSEG